MKYQEALDRIKSERLWDEGLGDYYNVFDRDNKDLKLIQELVDKATPKKVTQFEHEGNMYCWCHECDHVEMIKEIDFMNYCPNCGKRLDWSADE